MDPSAELLELLREIRDNQRELLAIMKVFEAKNEERYADWNKRYADWDKERADRKKGEEDWKKEIQKERDLWRKGQELYNQHQETWLRQQRRAKTLGVVLLLIGFIMIIVTTMIQRGFFK